MKDRFGRLVHATADAVGRPTTFIVAVSAIAVWAIAGPFLRFSNTWQLVINTATTVVTFLVVFLVHKTQNRDAQAIHLKLDELIRANTRARYGLLGLEYRSDQELVQLEAEFEALRDRVIGERQKRSRGPASPRMRPREKSEGDHVSAKI
ncbi:low affinity iron permease family protein [Labilithrix luteola]|uniref:low affinity iron permease family protein n=1 Tax=Labilithrix luteola TaxID=1391654 RepID=UPI0011BAD72A|nr:low affinity iron permease family protein [Labilithrix luteola]